MVLHLTASQIPDAIRSGKVTVAIIGLGQVGFPLALGFAGKGAAVVGADIDRGKVDAIRRGDCPPGLGAYAGVLHDLGSGLRATSCVSQAVKDSSIHIVCVPTLLTDGKIPDLSAVKAASAAIGRELREGSLVVLESSVYPGVTNTIVRPILEGYSGLKAGSDFGLAYCFERIDPGNREHRVDNTPRVVGGVDEASSAAAAAVYGAMIDAPVIQVRDCETAELVKLVENVYRDVNIAYANELSLLCDGLGVDILEVLAAAATKWNFTPYLPGAGVGGTCIPVNPYYMLQAAKEVGVELKLVRQAREVNENMPHHVVRLVKEVLSEAGKPVEKSRVCILGLTYKADVDDTRGAPAEIIARGLQQAGATVVCHDPVVSTAPDGIDLETSLDEAVRGSDCIVITNEHSAFASLDLPGIAALSHNPLAIVDGRHVLAPREVEALGIRYAGLGRILSSDLNVWNFGGATEGRGSRD